MSSSDKPVRDPSDDGSAVDAMALAAENQRLTRENERLAHDVAIGRLVAENAADVVVRVDAGGALAWISRGIESCLRWTQEEVRGTLLLDLIHPGDAGRFRGELERTLAGEGAVPEGGRAVIRLRTKPGGYRWMIGRGQPIVDGQGDVAGVVYGWSVADDLVQARERAEASEAFLRATLDSMIDPHVLLAAVRCVHGQIVDFVYSYVNDAASAYIPASKEELIGTTLMGRLPAHETTGLLAKYIAVAETGTPLFLDDYEYPEEILPRGRFFDVRVVKVGDSLSYSWRDVTAQHDASAALAASKEEFRLLAENAADVVIRFDADNNVVWVSPSVQRLLGYEPENLLGPLRVELIHPLDRARAQAAMAELGSGRALTVTEEVRLRRADGLFTWWQIAGRRTGDDPATSDVVAALRDVEAEVRARAVADAEQQRRAVVVSSMVDPYLLLRGVRGRSGRLLDFIVEDVNEAACTGFGQGFDELVGARLTRAATGLVSSGFLDRLEAVLDTGDPLFLDDAAYRSAAGTQSWIDLRAVRLGQDQLSVTWRDQTDRHVAAAALVASEARFRMLADNLADVLVELDLDGILTYVSGSMANVLGWQPDDLVGSALLDLVHPQDRGAMAAGAAVSHEADDGIAATRVRMRGSDGNYRWMGGVVREVRDVDGQPLLAVATWRDIQVEVEVKAALQKQAATDALTGLMNRRELITRVEGLLARKARTGANLAVLFIDLDRLKPINDRYGHAVGDAVIAGVAERLRAAVRADDLVARIGGDEFVVVLTSIHTLADATGVVEKIEHEMSVPIRIDGASIPATLSAGLALVNPGDDPDTALNRADTALYRAKQRGGARTAIYRTGVEMPGVPDRGDSG